MESIPIPPKDVKVNGQVKYFIQTQENNTSSTNMRKFKELSIARELGKEIQATNHIRFASCFQDGVYRYPSGLFDLLGIR